MYKYVNYSVEIMITVTIKQKGYLEKERKEKKKKEEKGSCLTN
jgi:hypothetical protein